MSTPFAPTGPGNTRQINAGTSGRFWVGIAVIGVPDAKLVMSL